MNKLNSGKALTRQEQDRLREDQDRLRVEQARIQNEEEQFLQYRANSMPHRLQNRDSLDDWQAGQEKKSLLMGSPLRHPQ